jgi:tetratricopeptide (TPR) repeat protein
VIASHSIRILSLITKGDVVTAGAELASMTRLARAFGRATQLWDMLAQQAMIALATGSLGEAERLMGEALSLGERALPEAAIPIYWVQRYTLCDLRGGLEQVEPDLAAVADEFPARPVFRAVLAHLHARLGRLAEARQALEQLTVDDCSAIPFDQEWLFALSLLAETSVLVGDPAAAAVVYRVFGPWSALNAVNVSEGFRGSVSRYLGQLAALLGRGDDAARHFEAAIAMNERMGARPWLAYTQEDYARLLAERDPERADELLAEARATYRELGMREPDGATRAPAGR